VSFGDEDSVWGIAGASPRLLEEIPNVVASV